MAACFILASMKKDVLAHLNSQIYGAWHKGTIPSPLLSCISWKWVAGSCHNHGEEEGVILEPTLESFCYTHWENKCSLKAAVCIVQHSILSHKPNTRSKVGTSCLEGREQVIKRKEGGESQRERTERDVCFPLQCAFSAQRLSLSKASGCLFMLWLLPGPLFFSLSHILTPTWTWPTHSGGPLKMSPFLGSHFGSLWPHTFLCLSHSFCLCSWHATKQKSINWSPWSKSSLPSVFVNQVLLAHYHAHLFMYHPCFLSHYKIEFNNRDRKYDWQDPNHFPSSLLWKVCQSMANRMFITA